MNWLFCGKLKFCFTKFCFTTMPRRASSNDSRSDRDRWNALLCLAELWRIDTAKNSDSYANLIHSGAVYISAKSKFVSTPQIARIIITSFYFHESWIEMNYFAMYTELIVDKHTFTNHLKYFLKCKKNNTLKYVHIAMCLRVLRDAHYCKREGYG